MGRTKTKGEAKWDALEAFGAQILFLKESVIVEPIRKRKRTADMTAGELADIYFQDKADEEKLKDPFGLPPNWFNGEV